MNEDLAKSRFESVIFRNFASCKSMIICQTFDRQFSYHLWEDLR